jgi:hypothetical protein
MIDLTLFNKVEVYKVYSTNLEHLKIKFKYQFIYSI